MYTAMRHAMLRGCDWRGGQKPSHLEPGRITMAHAAAGAEIVSWPARHPTFSTDPRVWGAGSKKKLLRDLSMREFEKPGASAFAPSKAQRCFTDLRDTESQVTFVPDQRKLGDQLSSLPLERHRGPEHPVTKFAWWRATGSKSNFHESRPKSRRVVCGALENSSRPAEWRAVSLGGYSLELLLSSTCPDCQ